MPTRTRKLKLSVLPRIVAIIKTYTPSRTSDSGSTQQIQDMIKSQAGVDLKRRQAADIVQRKKNRGVEIV